ncbi:MAG: hypothetical protein QW478_10740, partial [Candidatus Micrarchaeaceae archaeon]
MKIAFLIQQIHPSAGQTFTISEIIGYLSKVHEDWLFDVLTPEITYPLPLGLKGKNVSIIRINGLYRNILFPGKLANKLANYDVIYVKGSYPYVFPASRSGRPNILCVHQIDSPRLFRSISQKIRILATNVLTGYVIKKPTVVVTVTDELAAFYSERYGIDAKVIEDQIPDIFYVNSKRDEPEKEGKIRLLSVGPWDGFKGRKRQHLLLKYFA